MLTKKQINNYLKTKNTGDEINDLKNVITLSMIKYYNDMSIINMMDNIDINESKKVKTVEVNNNQIIINSSFTKLNKIEYILELVNYKYVNGNFDIKGINKVINILQVEDITKTLFKIVRLNNISYLEELSIIDNKTYRCFIDQVETNLLRPLYNFYKKKKRDLVKKNFINNIDINYVEEIDELFRESNNGDILVLSESYRKIKDIIKVIISQ